MSEESKTIDTIREFIEDSFQLPTAEREADIQKDIHELVLWVNSIWGVQYDAEILARTLHELGYHFTTGEIPQWLLCSKK